MPKKRKKVKGVKVTLRVQPHGALKKVKTKKKRKTNSRYRGAF